MDVVSACPLRVASLVWQPRPGAFVLTVVCKATYTLRPVESPLAPDQDPPNELDDHWNDDEHRSLHGASDLGPFKPRADVFLVGHAYAPRGQPASSLIVRMIVGDVDKSVEVHADRVWTQDRQLHQGPRFTKMPLRYERAGGGPMTSNPVGMRPDSRPDRHGRLPVPNLQPPGHHPARPEDAVPPIGLGPIAPTWPGRAAKLYGPAAGWDHRTGLRHPLPPGLDPGFFNAAPPDQQTAELRGNERIVLENLHPEHARLVTSLPGTAPSAVVTRPGAPPQALPLRCDTLSVDTDQGVCHLVWRAQLPLARADEAGRVVISTAGETRDRAVETLAGGMRAGAVMPFVRAEAPEPDDEANRRTMPMPMPAPAKPAMPFREVSPWEEAPAIATASEGASRGGNDGTGTVMGMMAPGGEVLPFVGEAPVVPVPVAAPILARVDASPWAPALRREDAERVAAPPPNAAEELPAQPEMIGPLATPEMAGTAGKTSPAPPEEPARAVPTTPAAPAAAAPAEDPKLPRERYPLERCAAIAASVASTGSDKARILREHGLGAGVWAQLDKHYLDHVRAQAGRGRTGPLRTYDAAYVAQIEKERGPIRVEEMAQLILAEERGVVEEQLAALRLPHGALLRIRRAWLAREADDPALGKSVRAAVEAAQEEE